jgi:hypothetical protein
MSGFVRVLAAIVLLVAASAPLAIAPPSRTWRCAERHELAGLSARWKSRASVSAGSPAFNTAAAGSSAKDQTASRTSALIVQVICAAA